MSMIAKNTGPDGAAAKALARPPAGVGIRRADIFRKLREPNPLLERLRPEGMPILYEDEGLEMGETKFHTFTSDILLYGLDFHFAEERFYQVFGNLNLYYSPEEPAAYISPDAMVVRPNRRPEGEVSSYQIGVDGPAPLVVAEVLSFRTFQQGDLSQKPILYATLGIPEYVLIDVTGAMLRQKLLLLRLRPDGNYLEEQGTDGGITSTLGFQLILDLDGHLRVINAKTGERYARPNEAGAEARARRKAEEGLRALRAKFETQRQGKQAPSTRQKAAKRRKKK